MHSRLSQPADQRARFNMSSDLLRVGVALLLSCMSGTQHKFFCRSTHILLQVSTKQSRHSCIWIQRYLHGACAVEKLACNTCQRGLQCQTCDEYPCMMRRHQSSASRTSAACSAFEASTPDACALLCLLVLFPLKRGLISSLGTGNET